MGVDHDSRLFEGIADEDVRSFPANPRQGDKFLHRGRNHTMKPLRDVLAAGDDILRFVLEKSRRSNELFDVRNARLRQIRCGTITLKQRWGDLIHAFVGALGGENRRDQQFPRRMMAQFHPGGRHRFLERNADLLQTLVVVVR